MIPKPTINFKEFYESDRAILVLCMCIALVFWLFTKLSQSYETHIHVDVKYKVPRGKILTTPPPSSLNVSLKSEGWDLFYRYLSGQPRQLEFRLDTATQQIITNEDLRAAVKAQLSSAISIESINPAELNLELDKPARKEVELQLVQRVTTIPQYQLAGNVQLLPNRIMISGPSSALRNIEKGLTQPLVIKNLNADAFGKINVKPFANTQINFTPKTVNYNANVEQFTEKAVQVPVQIINAKDSLIPNPAWVTVTSVIGISRFEDLETNSFSIMANAKNLDSLSKAIPLKIIHYPEYLKFNQIKLSRDSIGFFRYKKLDVLTE